MNKSATIRARIEPKLKQDVEALFHKLGLSATDAINIFYRQVKLRRGLPFSVVIPNETTKKIFEDTDLDKDVIHCSDEDEMFEKLDI